MRGTNRRRSLLVSGAIILLCMTVVVGMTWALFTDTKTITNHLKAGDLTITLKRTALVKSTLNEAGFLEDFTVQTTSDDPKDFTEPTDENVFAIGENEKLVPGSKFSATMQIENNSDVAFGYWIVIIPTESTKGENLVKQLKVTVTAANSDPNSPNSSFVGEGLIIGGEERYIEVLEVGASGTFTVTAEFVDQGYEYVDGVLVSGNDAAKNESLTFDLVVYAVQVIKDPTP